MKLYTDSVRFVRYVCNGNIQLSLIFINICYIMVYIHYVRNGAAVLKSSHKWLTK